ncbi:type III secretion system effector XopQ [Ralstonia solanacearum]|uniref:type III secretion system effector XopQ n=1 Tax=Ralstonia solanacearum TaxID=305 RepID=UPI00078BBD04|nr:type III secretion system effector XopQ [Ralstonia solanacearum]AMP38816.1 type III effector [Ralstonia solanacearum]AXV87644.1 type III secretion system effector protein [Ralstonia solanacearum]AXW07109.1 type III secretion system effector protein [Ralstonia solanacearum]AXW24889.1 type III secretion system effector protein [Ralstonia solanacearum]AXW81802.1 type III secretion system effector protein [Ralstonia solanacearum]
MKAAPRSPAYPSSLPDLAATAETDATNHPSRPHSSKPPGTSGAQKPPGRSIAGGPLEGLSKTGLGVVLPERAIRLPATENLGAPARLVPRARPASPDAVRRALLAAFWGSLGTLSHAERRLLNQLKSHRPPVPQPCILFTDPNKDPDDVVAFTLGKPLQVFGLANMTHAVTTLGEREVRTRRAGVAKGVFDRLDLPGVQVCVGRDYDIDPKRAKDHAKFLDEGEALRADLEAPTEDSIEALRKSLARATEKVALVVIAGMTDPSALVTAEPGLVKQKVGSVVIMGGVRPEKDADGFVQPDDRAYNNMTDFAAACHFYRRVQELGIPLRVVTREAVYRAAVPRAFYEDAAQSGHPVGQYLKDVQKNALNALWDGISEGVIAKLDKPWFFNTFIAREGGHDDAAAWAARDPTFDEIWEQVARLNLYDPMTLLAAVEGSAQMLFRPQAVQAEGHSPVEVIGADEVHCPEDARQLMSALVKMALADTPGTR